MRTLLDIENVGCAADCEVWRFVPTKFALDLFTPNPYQPDSGRIQTRSFCLRLSQVASFREGEKADPNESKLPDVIRSALQLSINAGPGRDFIETLLVAIEEQAKNVYASCWFNAGNRSQELRMWEKYGGGSEGGIAIVSTVEKLVASLLEINEARLFGIGRVQYIPRNLTFDESFKLGPYTSYPFLLKLSGEKARHEHDQEVRLYVRKYLLTSSHAQPTKAHIYVPFNPVQMINSIKLSPLCSAPVQQDIRNKIIERIPIGERPLREWLNSKFIV